MSDLISRQAAIDAMQDLPYGYRGMVRDIIYNLPPEKQNKICEFWDSESSFCALNRPSARPEQKWIPCTPKTMPPYWVLVWVTDNHGHVAVCQLSHKENHYWYDGDERLMYEHDSIIAWMPYNVPEPYQAERREDVSNQW